MLVCANSESAIDETARWQLHIHVQVGINLKFVEDRCCRSRHSGDIYRLLNERLTTYERNTSKGNSSNSAKTVAGSSVGLWYWAIFVPGALIS